MDSGCRLKGLAYDWECSKIKEKNCFEMLELEKAEARSLFLYYDSHGAHMEDPIEVDEEVIGCCERRCYFCRGPQYMYRYHLLALEVLGR